MDSIKNQTRRLNHLVKNLLELSKLDESAPAELFTEVDLSALVGEVAESFEVPAQAAGKTFFTEIQPGVTLAGSREELYKLTSILLDNALKYTNDGGTIRVSLQKQRRVALSVYNTCAYMRTPEQVAEIVRCLEEEYPGAQCSLDYGKDYELLFSVRLAAQCTDERVNQITPALFARFPTLHSFAEADVSEVEKYVHSCGFFRAKARDIVLCAQTLEAKFGGRVPGTMAAVTTSWNILYLYAGSAAFFFSKKAFMFAHRIKPSEAIPRDSSSTKITPSRAPQPAPPSSFGNGSLQ